ncbi:MAG: orotidine-5'-phosphate decarboxylase [Bacteroidales bacterium]|nr:orotidine-5'-phosphate decarboxylase [Bacteroidales bacterium]MCL2132849.1 orotidine-5'-phosphate decarboxylase [Bacteroidales bacterium]
MKLKDLYEQILLKRSFLCVGLDTDRERLPAHLLNSDEPLFTFNKAVIDATVAHTIAYKPNLAFYEAEGSSGWLQLEKTVAYIRQHYPKIFIIADAKRGDIGNTSKLYAEAFFKKMNVDAVTLSPYMGRDTVDPFLQYEEKWAVLLALTSNPSANDFELTEEAGAGRKLYEKVIATSMQWGNIDNLMYVVGATQVSQLESIRKIIPDHFLLIPGIGEQGGSLEEVAKYGMNKHCGLLVNSSRAIIFADTGERFAKAAGQKAQELQQQMAQLLRDMSDERHDMRI